MDLSELKSGVTSGFNKTVNEALQIAPTVRYFLSNQINPSLLIGVLKGAIGTPGQAAAISAEKDAQGNVRLSTTQLTALRGKEVDFLQGSIINGSDTMITVPTGKIYYLVSCTLTYEATANSAEAFIYKNLAGNVILKMISKITATYYTSDTGHAEIAFPYPIPFVAGDAIKVYSNSASLSANAMIVGFLEDA